jgi:hypothetical protein
VTGVPSRAQRLVLTVVLVLAVLGLAAPASRTVDALPAVPSTATGITRVDGAQQPLLAVRGDAERVVEVWVKRVPKAGVSALAAVLFVIVAMSCGMLGRNRGSEAITHVRPGLRHVVVSRGPPVGALVSTALR